MDPRGARRGLERGQGRVRAGVKCVVKAKGGLERQDQVKPRKIDDTFGRMRSIEEREA